MKNKFMRLASVMLVLTLLTTCGVSGTYAKYVTTASSSDTARVAKFGVTIESGTEQNMGLFKHAYAKYDDDTKYASITNSVQAASGLAADHLVAPGTAKSGSTYFTISGQPEVAVEITYQIKGGYKEPCVLAGEYKDWTTADNDTFEVTGDGYYPVKFTLKQGDKILLEKGTLEALQTTLARETIVCEAGTDLASLGTQAFTLSWEWAFEDTSVADVNKLDTLLGQVAAGKDNATGVITDLEFDLAITVTQID